MTYQPCASRIYNLFHGNVVRFKLFLLNFSKINGSF